jgi:hypothetical protein
MDTGAPALTLDHVQLAAPPSAEAAARRFFGEVLGLVELPKPEVLAKRGGCWFQLGGQELHIGIEADFKPAKKAHVAMRVADPSALAGLRARLVAVGAPIKEGDPLEGTARFFTEDPWGNRLELLSGK